MRKDLGRKHTIIANQIRLKVILCKALGMIHHAWASSNVPEDEYSYRTKGVLVLRVNEG